MPNFSHGATAESLEKNEPGDYAANASRPALLTHGGGSMFRVRIAFLHSKQILTFQRQFMATPICWRVGCVSASRTVLGLQRTLVDFLSGINQSTALIRSPTASRPNLARCSFPTLHRSLSRAARPAAAQAASSPEGARLSRAVDRVLAATPEAAGSAAVLEGGFSARQWTLLLQRVAGRDWQRAWAVLRFLEQRAAAAAAEAAGGGGTGRGRVLIIGVTGAATSEEEARRWPTRRRDVGT